MVSTLLFDIHEVVLLRSDARFRSLTHRFCVSPDDLTNAIHGDGLWASYRVGGMGEGEYWKTVTSRLSPSFRGTWQDLRDEMDLVDEVNEELVAWIRSQREKYRIAALSNAGADLERRLDFFQLMDLFAVVINSHRVKLAKPDEQIYRYSESVLHVPASEIMFVDDRLRNTSVADSLGFRTHVYTGFERFVQEFNLHAR